MGRLFVTKLEGNNGKNVERKIERSSEEKREGYLNEKWEE